MASSPARRRRAIQLALLGDTSSFAHLVILLTIVRACLHFEYILLFTYYIDIKGNCPKNVDYHCFHTCTNKIRQYCTVFCTVPVISSQSGARAEAGGGAARSSRQRRRRPRSLPPCCRLVAYFSLLTIILFCPLPSRGRLEFFENNRCIRIALGASLLPPDEEFSLKCLTSLAEKVYFFVDVFFLLFDRE